MEPNSKRMILITFDNLDSLQETHRYIYITQKSLENKTAKSKTLKSKIHKPSISERLEKIDNQRLYCRLP